MIILKKYSNGRFFDTQAKKYIKTEHLAELIKKGEKIQVTLTKTGKDITDSVIEQFSKKGENKESTQSKKKKGSDILFLKNEKLVKWVGDIIDDKIEKVMNIVNLPTREQVAQLDNNIQALNKKIDELKQAQEKSSKKKKTAATRKAAGPKKAAGSGNETVKKTVKTPEPKPATPDAKVKIDPRKV